MISNSSLPLLYPSPLDTTELLEGKGVSEINTLCTELNGSILNVVSTNEVRFMNKTFQIRVMENLQWRSCWKASSQHIAIYVHLYEITAKPLDPIEITKQKETGKFIIKVKLIHYQKEGNIHMVSRFTSHHGNDILSKYLKAKEIISPLEDCRVVQFFIGKYLTGHLWVEEYIDNFRTYRCEGLPQDARIALCSDKTLTKKQEQMLLLSGDCIIDTQGGFVSTEMTSFFSGLNAELLTREMFNKLMSKRQKKIFVYADIELLSNCTSSIGDTSKMRQILEIVHELSQKLETMKSHPTIDAPSPAAPSTPSTSDFSSLELQ